MCNDVNEGHFVYLCRVNDYLHLPLHFLPGCNSLTPISKLELTFPVMIHLFSRFRIFLKHFRFSAVLHIFHKNCDALMKAAISVFDQECLSPVVNHLLLSMARCQHSLSILSNLLTEF